MNSLQLYLRYTAISVRGQMQYRASFVMMTFGQLMITGVEFLGIWALFQRFGSLRGWTLPQVALLYGMVNVAFAFADAFGRGFDLFPEMVRLGDFDRLLLRPRDTAFQVGARELTLMRVGRLLQGVVVLGWGAARLNIAWTAPKLALLIAAILGGACMFCGLFVLQATMSFWTIESLEIMNTVTYGGTETAQYPLPIYQDWFRRFFTWVVPLACVNYLPVQAILGRPDPLGAPPALQWAAPLVGIAFMLLCLQAWKLGVRHYRSTGS